MLQQLLADYFKVTLHQESRDLPVYELRRLPRAAPNSRKLDGTWLHA